MFLESRGSLPQTPQVGGCAPHTPTAGLGGGTTQPGGRRGGGREPPAGLQNLTQPTATTAKELVAVTAEAAAAVPVGVPAAEAVAVPVAVPEVVALQRCNISSKAYLGTWPVCAADLTLNQSTPETSARSFSALAHHSGVLSSM
jgi:hypothetical protein